MHLKDEVQIEDDNLLLDNVMEFDRFPTNKWYYISLKDKISGQRFFNLPELVFNCYLEDMEWKYKTDTREMIMQALEKLFWTRKTAKQIMLSWNILLNDEVLNLWSIDSINLFIWSCNVIYHKKDVSKAIWFMIDDYSKEPIKDWRYCSIDWAKSLIFEPIYY